MLGSAITGGNMGYSLSSEAFKSDEIKLFNLKKERDRLENMITQRKKELNE